jgi:hypothetical protein
MGNSPSPFIIGQAFESSASTSNKRFGTFIPAMSILLIFFEKYTERTRVLFDFPVLTNTVFPHFDLFDQGKKSGVIFFHTWIRWKTIGN